MVDVWLTLVNTFGVYILDTAIEHGLSVLL